MLSYRGFTASYEKEDDGDKSYYHGRLDNIRDIVTFEADEEADIKEAFQGSVDDYLDMLDEDTKLHLLHSHTDQFHLPSHLLDLGYIERIFVSENGYWYVSLQKYRKGYLIKKGDIHLGEQWIKCFEDPTLDEARICFLETLEEHRQEYESYRRES